MIFAVVINNLPSEVNTVHGGEPPPPRTRATPANFNLHGEATRPECPINAIYAEEDLPEDQEYTTELNALFFTDGPGYDALDMV